MLINRKQWKENQFPEEWSFNVESETLRKNLGAKLLPTKTDTRTTDDKREVKPPMLMLQYRGNLSQLFANKVRSITNAQIAFMTRKLKTALPSLKLSLSRELKPNLVYKLSCSGCNSTYVGQTVRHLATRIEEHKKEDSLVGVHIHQENLVAGSGQVQTIQNLYL